MAKILKVDNVSKYYGNLKALNGVSFEVPENSIFALLGPNAVSYTHLTLPTILLV